MGEPSLPAENPLPLQQGQPLRWGFLNRTVRIVRGRIPHVKRISYGLVRKLSPSCQMSNNPLGRPREFSSEEALIAANLVFAEKGFEGASLADLTKAMGINRTNMYATFGNKEQLFRLTMERFTQAGAKHIEECLAAGTAREGVERVLRESVKRFTDPHGPGVCFLTQEPLTGSDASDETRQYAGRKRAAIELALRDLFDRAIQGGELPHKVSSEGPARFYAVVIQGLALQAQHGSTREQLLSVVDMAMASWPGADSKSGKH
jgi:AcrR family transcriptional regulator